MLTPQDLPFVCVRYQDPERSAELVLEGPIKVNLGCPGVTVFRACDSKSETSYLATLTLTMFNFAAFNVCNVGIYICM